MSRFVALVPAAGYGSRMGGALPKQYLPLLERPLIEHTIFALAAHPRIDKVYVVLSPEDSWWSGQGIAHDKLSVLRCGGAARAQSVANGLKAIAGEVAADDCVLVHDAARPCLRAEHLDRMLAELADDPVGGILAVPVADTLKRAQAGQRIAETVPREGLWQAQTPQMFRHGLLLKALEAAGSEVTDEASAIERMGLQPRLVEGDVRNLKVTYPRDLELAALILEHWGTS
jgi:2-C-methyl-D-erythritol 4-phosphate cytidylyltransferase